MNTAVICNTLQLLHPEQDLDHMQKLIPWLRHPKSYLYYKLHWKPFTTFWVILAHQTIKVEHCKIWIYLPELYFRHRIPPVPPNYNCSSTGCQFDSRSLTSWRSSPAAHDQPAHQSTWRTSSETTTHLALCDQLIIRYCLYCGWHYSVIGESL